MEKDLSKHLEKAMDDITKLSNDLTMLSEMDVESLSVEDVKRYVEKLHNASSELVRLREIVDKGLGGIIGLNARHSHPCGHG